ncbi:MAG: THUMP domain-containing protein [archaeon]
MVLIIIRCAEIATKGKNRKNFEDMLLKNIRLMLKVNSINEYELKKSRGRILLFLENITEKIVLLKKIFGICSYSVAKETKQDISFIKEEVLSLSNDFTEETKFRVTAKRTDKSFALDSVEINKIIVEFIVSTTKAKVSLVNYDIQIFIELFGGKAYIYNKIEQCYGGLPVGIQGRVGVLIKKDSLNLCLLNSILLMKRGCEIIPIGDECADISVLNDYFHKLKLYTKPAKSDLEIKFQMEKYYTISIALPFTSDNIKKELGINGLQLSPLVGYTNAEIKIMEGKYL